MNIKDRFTSILETWFLQEPMLFQVICTHSFEENKAMPCPLRSGKRRIEYNPDFVGEMSDDALEQTLRTEAIRILLKHPYQRRPEGCSMQAAALGSNITIGDNYKLGNIPVERPSDYGLPSGQPYEWYARRVQSELPSSDGSLVAISELWDEDELTVTMINRIIESTREWGSIGGHLAEVLKASTKAKINWRNVLSGFRASILSSKRKLTRMRPNRRTGFENMGSIRRFDTKLLVAVDVSGSISSQDLSYFFGVINGAFRYGFSAIDVIQFDAGVRVVQSLKKAIKEVAAVGRGGTSFQEPIDYAHENSYDGLVILTDGCAPEPKIPLNSRCGIVWVCDNKSSYDHCHDWMEKSGRVCVMELNN